MYFADAKPAVKNIGPIKSGLQNSKINFDNLNNVQISI